MTLVNIWAVDAKRWSVQWGETKKTRFSFSAHILAIYGEVHPPFPFLLHSIFSLKAFHLSEAFLLAPSSSFAYKFLHSCLCSSQFYLFLSPFLLIIHLVGTMGKLSQVVNSIEHIGPFKAKYGIPQDIEIRPCEDGYSLNSFRWGGGGGWGRFKYRQATCFWILTNTLSFVRTSVPQIFSE